MRSPRHAGLPVPGAARPVRGAVPWVSGTARPVRRTTSSARGTVPPVGHRLAASLAVLLAVLLALLPADIARADAGAVRGAATAAAMDTGRAHEVSRTHAPGTSDRQDPDRPPPTPHADDPWTPSAWTQARARHDQLAERSVPQDHPLAGAGVIAPAPFHGTYARTSRACPPVSPGRSAHDRGRAPPAPTGS